MDVKDSDHGLVEHGRDYNLNARINTFILYYVENHVISFNMKSVSNSSTWQRTNKDVEGEFKFYFPNHNIWSHAVQGEKGDALALQPFNVKRQEMWEMLKDCSIHKHCPLSNWSSIKSNI